MKPNTIGNWVISDGERFWNPRNGKMDNFFVPSKHLFHEWRKVCWHIQGIGDPKLHVETVELHPTFTPIQCP